MSRDQGYHWLSKKMKKKRCDTHFGKFTYDEILKAKKILKKNLKIY